MKQIQFGHYGEPKDVVAVADQPLPEPRANQVRVRTKELLETNQLLLKTQKELLAYKKGLTV